MRYAVFGCEGYYDVGYIMTYKTRDLKVVTFSQGRGIRQKQTFELLPEHRFSPNNIHAFTISEPRVLPIFFKAIHAVGYKPHSYTFV